RPHPERPPFPTRRSSDLSVAIGLLPVRKGVAERGVGHALRFHLVSKRWNGQSKGGASLGKASYFNALAEFWQQDAISCAHRNGAACVFVVRWGGAAGGQIRRADNVVLVRRARLRSCAGWRTGKRCPRSEERR